MQVEAALVTPNFLKVLGVRPIRGRDFDRREETDFVGGSLLIGEGFWTRQYGADPSIIGRTITVGGSPSTVVGILPSGVLPRGADVWFSAAGLGKDAPDLGVLKLIGRLKPGRSHEHGPGRSRHRRAVDEHGPARRATCSARGSSRSSIRSTGRCGRRCTC